MSTIPQRISSVHRIGRSRYALVHGAQRVPLPEGELIVGRGAECDIVLDSHIVSRRHARIHVTDAGVFIEDLASINGVTIDGRRISGRTRLVPGAKIGLADVELVVADTADDRSSRVTARVVAPTNPSPPSDARPRVASEERKRRIHAFQLVTGVVDRALALGKPAEAERLLGGLLQDVLAEAQTSREIPNESAEAAAKTAIKLAAATCTSEWAEYPVRLFLALERVLPMPMIDDLYTLARRVRIDPALLDRYANALLPLTQSPTDRFAVLRIQTLARMAAVVR
jgi:hypothetical protein